MGYLRTTNSLLTSHEATLDINTKSLAVISMWTVMGSHHLHLKKPERLHNKQGNNLSHNESILGGVFVRIFVRIDFS